MCGDEVFCFGEEDDVSGDSSFDSGSSFSDEFEEGFVFGFFSEFDVFLRAHGIVFEDTGFESVFGVDSEGVEEGDDFCRFVLESHFDEFDDGLPAEGEFDV